MEKNINKSKQTIVEHPLDGDWKEWTITIPCHVSLPARFKIPDNFLFSCEYEIHIYAGARPDSLDQVPSGKILCKCNIRETASIVADGTASFFIIYKNGKAVRIGSIGTAGTELVLPTRFVKGGSFAIDTSRRSLL